VGYKRRMTPLASTYLPIDFAPTPWAGLLGMSACPGARPGWGNTDGALVQDVAAIAQQGVRVVVSLLDTLELQRLGAKNLSHHLGLHGIAWHQLPVVDYGVPSRAVTVQWRRLVPQLTSQLQSGNILIHCAHGKGRTGTLAATLFKAWGWSSDAAIARIRQYRLGAIETHKQEAYIEAFELQPDAAGD
jgi:protein-tyrosine phosphatase